MGVRPGHPLINEKYFREHKFLNPSLPALLRPGPISLFPLLILWPLPLSPCPSAQRHAQVSWENHLPPVFFFFLSLLAFSSVKPQLLSPLPCFLVLLTPLQSAFYLFMDMSLLNSLLTQWTSNYTFSLSAWSALFPMHFLHGRFKIMASLWKEEK